MQLSVLKIPFDVERKVASSELNPSDVGVVHHARNLIAGKWFGSNADLELREPYRGQIVTTICVADEMMAEAAVEAASKTASRLTKLKGFERAKILRRASELLLQRAEVVTQSITRETGKTIRDASIEVQRASEVLSFCADEVVRIEGRYIPLDGSPSGAGKVALSLWFPVGVVAANVPFNAPINLACHKVWPAFAAGNPVVLKAPPQAARTLHLLFEVFDEAGFPEGTINLLQGDAAVGQTLVADPRVAFISFTGSGKAGLAIKAVSGLRGCILELGGVGPTIVHDDANINDAAEQCVVTGFRLAGQSCASVQNLFVHSKVVEKFTDLMVSRVKSMKVGDPMDSSVDIGPVIDESAAERIKNWIDEAVKDGATLLCGGQRNGTMLSPTLLTDVRPEMKVVCEEVFGLIVVIRPYDNLADVHRWINDTGLGLNCGLFTESHAVAFETLRAVPCASLIINGTCTYRPDQMPYGGLRNSGYGRESPRDSIHAMTH